MAISFTVSYTFSPSTTISSSQVNTNTSDVANVWNGLEAKTKTFSNLGVDTELKSGGVISAANGAVGAPSITFTNSTGSGIYRIGADDIGIATNSTLVLEINNAGLITAYKNIVFSPTTGGIVGTTTNDDAATGNVGQVISSSVSGVSLSTATYKTITSVNLTAGDWDVSGMVGFVGAAGTSCTNFSAGISLTNNTRPAIGTFCIPNSSGEVFVEQLTAAAVLANGVGASATISPTRVKLTTTTTYYLVAQAVFTVSTLTSQGIIYARRVR